MQTNEQNEVKFCPYCGTKSFGKGVFCHQCGQKLLINVESDNNDVTTTPSVDLSADGNTDNLTQEEKSSNKIDKTVKRVTAGVLAVIAFVLLGIILGGGSKKSAIVGTWVTDDESSRYASLTFKSNGYFECERYSVRLAGLKQSYLGEDRETGEVITAAPEEPTTKAPHVYYGTWEITDNDILIINYGDYDTIELYWTDISGDSSTETWNVQNGELTFSGKVFNK